MIKNDNSYLMEQLSDQELAMVSRLGSNFVLFSSTKPFVMTDYILYSYELYAIYAGIKKDSDLDLIATQIKAICRLENVASRFESFKFQKTLLEYKEKKRNPLHLLGVLSRSQLECLSLLRKNNWLACRDCGFLEVSDQSILEFHGLIAMGLIEFYDQISFRITGYGKAFTSNIDFFNQCETAGII